MKRIDIERHRVEGATRSVWQVDNHTFYGIEQPWRDNLPYHICFPAGVYSLVPWLSPTHGECFVFIGGTVALLEDELAPPSITRFSCFVHVANSADEVEGCSGIGTTVGSWTNGTPVVLNSRVALGRLQQLLRDDPYHLAHIRWAA